jgi:hypothetical protein
MAMIEEAGVFSCDHANQIVHRFHVCETHLRSCGKKIIRRGKPKQNND